MRCFRFFTFNLSRVADHLRASNRAVPSNQIAECALTIRSGFVSKRIPLPHRRQPPPFANLALTRHPLRYLPARGEFPKWRPPPVFCPDASDSSVENEPPRLPCAA